MASAETEVDQFANATPRPWHVYEGGNFVKIGAEGYDEYVERKHYMGGPLSVADLEHNATENYKPNHRKAMANAALIVAAVNSYSPSDAEQLAELAEIERDLSTCNSAVFPITVEMAAALCQTVRALRKWNQEGCLRIAEMLSERESLRERLAQVEKEQFDECVTCACGRPSWHRKGDESL